MTQLEKWGSIPRSPTLKVDVLQLGHQDRDETKKMEWGSTTARPKWEGLVQEKQCFSKMLYIGCLMSQQHVTISQGQSVQTSLRAATLR